MEILSIVIGASGLLIAWVTYEKSFKAKPDEEMEALKVYFMMNQKTMDGIIHSIENHISENGDGYFEGSILFSTYLDKLRSERDYSLSDDRFKSIEDLPLTKTLIAGMQRSLELQFNNLQTVKEYLNTAHSIKQNPN